MSPTTDTVLPDPAERRRGAPWSRLTDSMVLDLPEGSHGTCEIRRFHIGADHLGNMLESIKTGRGTRNGTYTGLYRSSHLWMSDTDAEAADHYDAARQIDRRGGRILIGGLGLGMILRAALLTPTVTHVDVVEIDEDVVALVGPHYQAMAAEHGKTLTIHHADLYAIKWPAGTRWDVAWFDIWPDLCTDNLDEMTKLRRSYGRRTDWQECWGRQLLLRHRAAEARRPRWGW